METQNKRSARIVMTNEARVLRELRIQNGLSMRKAADLINRSDSYIAHIETGRIDVPEGEKLEKLLQVYGGIKQKSFNERVRNFSSKITQNDELQHLIERLSDQQITLLLKIAKNI